MDNPQQTLSEAELGWMAGILDGEGSICLFLGVRKGGKLNHVSPQVSLGNTDKAMIEEFVRIANKIGTGVHVHERQPAPGGVPGMKPKRAKSYKRMHFASIVGFQRVRTLLTAVTPYLVTSKRQKSELLLQFIDQRLTECQITSYDGRGVYSNRPYTEADLKLMLDILAMQHSKHTTVVEGLLRDYTRGRHADAVA